MPLKNRRTGKSEKSQMKIALIFGTRPEAIKLAPVILELKKRDRAQLSVCVTGQHRQMLDEALAAFGIVPDEDLGLMQPNQSLASFTGRAVEALDRYLTKLRPDAVLVQGDTTTVLCGALAAFYHRIKVGHVEAGLRTHQKYSPFPEEKNRELASRLADWHFAPTQSARENLLAEGISEDKIQVTGNTVIDALYLAREKVKDLGLGDLPELGSLAGRANAPGARMILVTGHRRESFGEGFEQICRGLKRIALAHPQVQIVYPVHLNPNVREPVSQLLAGVGNIHLMEPLGYLPFVKLMDMSHFILTDSGGVQEEAPALGKPVLVMRQVTERPEAVEAGVVRLVGADQERIFQAADLLLRDQGGYKKMARGVSPYGDGRAAGRIADAVLKNEE